MQKPKEPEQPKAKEVVVEETKSEAPAPKPSAKRKAAEQEEEDAKEQVDFSVDDEVRKKDKVEADVSFVVDRIGVGTEWSFTRLQMPTRTL